MPQNPFRFTTPVRGDKFLGRDVIVEKFTEELCSISGDSFEIIGGRRFGKSSLLLAMQDQLMELLENDKDADWLVLPVFIPLEALVHASAQDVLGLMLHKIKKATCGAKRSGPLQCEPLVDLGISAYTELVPREATLQELEAAIEESIDAAYGNRGVMLRITLLIDETDHILNYPWTKSLFGLLRSLIYDSRVRDHIRLVLAGSGHLLDVHERGSPLLNACKAYFLEPFTEEAARALINHVPNISNDIADEILKQGAGHPFILQHLLHYIVEGESTSITMDTIDAEVRRFIHDRHSDLEGWWYALGKDGQLVYCILSESMCWMTPAEIIQIANNPNLQISRGLTVLCYHGFIIHDGTYKKFHISGQLFQNWAMDKNKPYESREVLRMSENYTDFDLHIASNGHVIASSSEGQATADISTIVPNSIRLSQTLIKRREVDANLLMEIGQELYEWIFPSNIHTHFHQTEAIARAQGAKLRLRLRIEADSIASLPLEFLYRSDGGYFFAANPNTVLSRYLNLPLPPYRVRRRAGPLHLLAIIADPIDQTRLNPDEWEALMKEALNSLLDSGQMTLKIVKNATRKEIRNALMERKPDIIQFVGHGIYHEGKGYLALVDDKTGGTWLLDDARFANLYLGFDDHLGLISLATCESATTDSPQSFLGVAPQLVQRGIPAVVAMQYSVSVDTAKIFLGDFYVSIAAGKPVDWAVQWARNAISQEFGLDNREFVTPVLYMRAKDGQVF